MNKSTDRYRFDPNDYEKIKEINRGGFGIILLVKNKKTNEEVVAKINFVDSAAADNAKFVQREVSILIRVQHPTMIRFRGFSLKDFSDNNNITILMDYMKEGSLAELIDKIGKSLKPDGYENTQKQIILAGIARGLMVLHSKGVIHRDIKPENILLDSNFHPKITDFGLSKIVDPNNTASQSMAGVGTLSYMAPEVISSCHYNTKADVYSFGILMYEILSDSRAYTELFSGKKRVSSFQFQQKIASGYRPKLENDIKKEFRELIKQCWSENPRERPSFSELYKKLSLSSIDDNLEKNAQKEEEDDGDENDRIMYCLDDVDTEVFFDYIDMISEDSAYQEPVSNSMKNDYIKEIEELKKQLSKLNEIDILKEKIIKLEKTISDQADEIESLKNEIIKTRNANSRVIVETEDAIFVAKLSMTEPGIFSRLKNLEKDKFKPYFVASQSSNDLYHLIDSTQDDAFNSTNNGKCYIEFVLQKQISLNGIHVFNSEDHFPRSFNIEVDGDVVKSIVDAKELKGSLKDMVIKFSQRNAQTIRFVQTGPNWDCGNNFVYFKKFELLSPDSKYKNGVFKALIEKSDEKDPHKCGVIINANVFDFNSFYNIESNSNIYIDPYQNAWFQVELTKGKAIITGFRLKRCGVGKLKSYKIIASDDCNRPVESWETLIEIDEITEDEHKKLDVYRLPHPSNPVKVIRLVRDGVNWANNLNLKFYHFDIFGSYLE